MQGVISGVTTMPGAAKVRATLSRERLRAFIAARTAASGGGAVPWERRLERPMAALGHAVRLVAPLHVPLFVTRRENDAAGAGAVLIAARRPGLGFVAPKSADRRAGARCSAAVGHLSGDGRTS